MAEAVDATRRQQAATADAVESLDVRQRARRDRIVQATVQLMRDHDYDSLQMKDITAAAGVALGTTYRYFNSKDHLVAEALLAWSSSSSARVDCPTGRSVDRVKIAFRRAARAFELLPVRLRPHARGAGVDRSARDRDVRRVSPSDGSTRSAASSPGCRRRAASGSSR